jgi:hypothetical protein
VTETVVVFGSQRIAAIWALRNGKKVDDIILATQSARLPFPEKVKGDVMIIRTSAENWEPTTNPCAARVRETEQWLRDVRGEICKDGRTIQEFRV